jgi:hypothetical protein
MFRRLALFKCEALFARFTCDLVFTFECFEA